MTYQTRKSRPALARGPASKKSIIADGADSSQYSRNRRDSNSFERRGGYERGADGRPVFVPWPSSAHLLYVGPGTDAPHQAPPSCDEHCTSWEQLGGVVQKVLAGAAGHVGGAHG